MPNGRVTEFEDESPQTKKQIADDCAQTLVGRTGMDSKWMYGSFEDFPAADGQQVLGYVASRVKNTLICKSMTEGADQ